jgi:SAM-dependent methyltransferase
MKVDTAKFDFLDFGCSSGGSLHLAKKRFGGKAGLGIDNSPEQCALARKNGFKVLCADARTVVLPNKSVKFSMLAHFLEHLPNVSATKEVLQTAARASTDFLFIEGPSFDFDVYLRNRGLKFFWTDGCGHHNLLQLHTLKTLITKLPAHSYTVMLEQPFVKDSSSRDIHSLKSPYNVTYYDKKIHPPKPLVKFDKHVFRSFIVFVWLRNLAPKLREYLVCGRPKFKVVLHKNLR